ncbi:MAG: hypothetical protein LBL00_00300 [Endomicrobium sp.]|jgi:hypothetical protein|nr:hypothetical protein [Endomicrobium sp.]
MNLQNIFSLRIKKVFSILAVFCLFLLCFEKAISAVILFDAANVSNVSANLPADQTQIKKFKKLQNLIDLPTDIISSFLANGLSVFKITASGGDTENKKKDAQGAADKNAWLINGGAGTVSANVFPVKHFEMTERHKTLLYALTLSRTQNQKNTMTEIFLFLIVLMLMTVMKSHAVSLQNGKNGFYYILKSAF